MDNTLEAGRVEELPAIEILDRLLTLELAARQERRVETNLKFAGLPYRQRLEDFDFDAQPSVDPALVGRLAMLQFLRPPTPRAGGMAPTTCLLPLPPPQPTGPASTHLSNPNR